MLGLPGWCWGGRGVVLSLCVSVFEGKGGVGWCAWVSTETGKHKTLLQRSSNASVAGAFSATAAVQFSQGEEGKRSNEALLRSTAFH